MIDPKNIHVTTFSWAPTGDPSNEQFQVRASYQHHHVVSVGSAFIPDFKPQDARQLCDSARNGLWQEIYGKELLLRVHHLAMIAEPSRIVEAETIRREIFALLEPKWSEIKPGNLTK
jgi:hypothetical protein